MNSNHRVKNTLATVQSIAAYTFRSGTRAEATQSFESRIMALSRTHDVLTREHWVKANVREIVSVAVAPACDGGERIRFDGPDVDLSPKLALSFAIALHELYTNASKYGALSTNLGHVTIEWSLKSQPRLSFCWRESEGPTVTQPRVKGFGTRVIEGTLAREHDAQVTLDFAASGVACVIEVAVP